MQLNHHHASSVIITFSLLLMLIALFSLPSETSSRCTSPAHQPIFTPLQGSLEFNGTRAFTFLENQCAFGPRPPGSNNLTECGDYIITVLENAGWGVQTQVWTYHSTSLRNIMAGAITAPRYVVLAHYDTRPIAEMDPDPANRTKPILGANDGGSGVAALLELASVLPPEAKDQVMLLFVDAEDSGNYDGWEWIVGSTHFVNSLTDYQKNNMQAAVLLDMMGDADLQLMREQSSTQNLVDAIWEIAATMGYDDVFLGVPGFTMWDDHRPFLSAGIPALDIIDFEYPYWHTQADTPDKCSPSSLEAVGRVVEDFVQRQLVLPTSFRPQDPMTSLPVLFFLVVGVPVIALVILIIFVYWRKFIKILNESVSSPVRSGLGKKPNTLKFDSV